MCGCIILVELCYVWFCCIWRSMMEDDVLLKKLCWCCCRGMCELDQLFGCYLDCEWSIVLIGECEVFLFLFDCEDDKLWCWFMGYEVCLYVYVIFFMQKIFVFKF